MNVVIINPPLVQLNAPYPSGAYLSAFFKQMNCNVKWYDLSIQLFYSIFSKSGLQKLFSLSEENAKELAQKAEKQGDDATAFNLRRYISTKESWIEWIDFITAILSDKKISGREKAHQFLYSPFAPRGNRMDNYFSSLTHNPTVDDVRFLCSYAIADLADYITVAFDKDFSLIRYAEAVVSQKTDFIELEQKLNSPVLKEFYLPVLEKTFGCLKEIHSDEQTLFCISVPFAGTFLPSLYTARFIKQKYGEDTLVSLGGGYVNTELRNFENPLLVKYITFLSFDRGYGSYNQLLREFEKQSSDTSNKDMQISYLNKEILKNLALKEIYKLRTFINLEEKTIVTKVCWQNKEMEIFEDEVTANLVPDYSEIDFGQYLRVCDDENPMHRLWTDGTWIKAYLAHGCYWHKCAFCDTKLDYVCGYKPVNVEKLYDGLLKTAREKGIYGIHFVDEALPAASLKKIALLNARNGNQLYFWGNVRFEKSFTKDLAAFLSYCGFGAVSAGIEVATGIGLKNINKGTDISSIVSACAAFKEAGILVHAYMIYGFWYDTPQTIIDSMETLRQFFAAGLLDSAFWHKFILTENSQLYDNLKDSWKGGKEFEKFGLPLENALNSWMHGEKFETKVQKWFDFSVPSPMVPKNLIEQQIQKYEDDYEKQNSIEKKDLKDIYWLGSIPIVITNNISWFYLQEENNISFADAGIKNNQYDLQKIFIGLKPEAEQNIREETLLAIKKAPEIQKLLKKLKGCGFVEV